MFMNLKNSETQQIADLEEGGHRQIPKIGLRNKFFEILDMKSISVKEHEMDIWQIFEVLELWNQESNNQERTSQEAKKPINQNTKE